MIGGLVQIKRDSEVYIILLLNILIRVFIVFREIHSTFEFGSFLSLP